MKIIKKLMTALAGMLNKEFVLFVVLWMLMSFPTCLAVRNDGFHFASMHFVTGVLECLSLSLVLTALSALNRFVKYAILTLVCLLAFVDTYVFISFGTRISERIVLIVNQTNAKEAAEFLSNYFFTVQTAEAAIAVLTVVVLSCIAGRLVRRYILPRIEPLLFGVATVFLFAASSALVAHVTWADRVEVWLSTPPFIQAARAVSMAHAAIGDISALEQVTLKADGVLRENADRPDRIVWVIGESFNKHHSPLYGYPLNTQPQLTRHRDNGDVIVFADVVTPSAATAIVMDKIFSVNPDDSCRGKVPIVLTLLHNAGYSISLHDNQVTRANGDLRWDNHNMWFLNSPVVESSSVDYRNDALREYDLDFVRQELPHAVDGSPSLAIFHLMGQHMPARNRYPSDFNVFTPADYDRRIDLDEKQMRQLACYDNSILYNDAVIAEIVRSLESQDAILIYHSDHGEEIHDFRNHYGRTLEPVTADIHRCVYEVPMFVYTTPLFRHRHPQLYRRIVDASTRRLDISDMSRLLLDIAAVQSRYSEPGRSPLDD